MGPSGDLGMIHVQIEARQGATRGAPQRVFKAPELIFEPPAHLQPFRGGRYAFIPEAKGLWTGHDSP